MPRNETQQTKFYIANGGAIGRYAEVGPNLVIDTGLANLDEYATKELAMTELSTNFPLEFARVSEES